VLWRCLFEDITRFFTANIFTDKLTSLRASQVMLFMTIPSQKLVGYKFLKFGWNQNRCFMAKKLKPNQNQNKHSSCPYCRIVLHVRICLAANVDCVTCIWFRLDFQHCISLHRTVTMKVHAFFCLPAAVQTIRMAYVLHCSISFSLSVTACDCRYLSTVAQCARCSLCVQSAAVSNLHS